VPSGTSFCFSGLPARRTLIFLGLLRITPGRSRSGLRGTSSFARLQRPGSDFTNCRVEPLPSGTRRSLIASRNEPGVETFPAVYRTPCLSRHCLVMNSQTFPDGACQPEGRPTHSHSRTFGFTGAGDYAPPREGWLLSSRGNGHSAGATARGMLFPVYRWPHPRGHGSFSSFGDHSPVPIDCSRDTGGRLGVRPAHQLRGFSASLRACSHPKEGRRRGLGVLRWSSGGSSVPRARFLRPLRRFGGMNRVHRHPSFFRFTERREDSSGGLPLPCWGSHLTERRF
jgi:hypothetical protein